MGTAHGFFSLELNVQRNLGITTLKTFSLIRLPDPVNPNSKEESETKQRSCPFVAIALKCSAGRLMPPAHVLTPRASQLVTQGCIFFLNLVPQTTCYRWWNLISLSIAP